MSILLSPEGEEGEEILRLTSEEEEDAKKAFKRAEKNEYYIDRAGPDSERYSKPRLVGLEGNPTEEEAQRMKEMIKVVLKEDTHFSLEKLKEKQQKEEKSQSNSLNNSGRGLLVANSGTYTELFVGPESYLSEPSLSSNSNSSNSFSSISSSNSVNNVFEQLLLQQQQQQQPPVLCTIGTPENSLSMLPPPSPPQRREKTIEERWEKAVKELVVVGTLKDGGDAEKRRNKAYENLMSVCKDFRAAASAYGKIVLLEDALNNEKRTIKTKNVGGIAGGSKYKIDDKIMFKSPKGEKRQSDGGDGGGLPYPSYDAEAKVSGHELKSAAHLFGALVASDVYVQRGDKKPGSKEEVEEEEQRICDKVIVPPLMALVEYLGRRTVAMTVLPVGKINSPPDGAKDVCIECGTALVKGQCSFCGSFCDMCPVCKKPRSQQHAVGSGSDNTTLIYGSADGLMTAQWDPEIHSYLGKVSKANTYTHTHWLLTIPFLLLYF